MQKVYYASLAELSRLIQSKALSCQQLMTLFLDRIAKVNTDLNAIVQFDPSKAILEAQNADAALARNEPLSPLHGIPFTVKDCCYVKDFICTTGTEGWKSVKATFDATCVARLKAAGMIVLGITNTPELLAAVETDNLVYGRTNNPYDLSRTPGGSSGGEASIIAAGGSPVGLGSDGGGSIRIPAHFTGICGIKPTQGLLPLTGFHIPVHGLGWIFPFGTFGPLARYVDDLRMILPILAGYDIKDPFSVPVALSNPQNVPLKSLKVAYYLDDGLVTPDVEIQQTVQLAIEALSKHDLTITPARPEGIKEAFDLLWGYFFQDGDGAQHYREKIQQLGTENLSALHEAFIEDSKTNKKDLSTYLKGLEKIGDFRMRMQSFIEAYDIIICPAYPTVAPHHGETLHNLKNANYAMPFNLTGWPAMVVRCGTSKEGLPIGVQIVGRPWQDHVVLAVGQFLEKIFGGWQKSGL